MPCFSTLSADTWAIGENFQLRRGQWALGWFNSHLIREISNLEWSTLTSVRILHWQKQRRISLTASVVDPERAEGRLVHHKLLKRSAENVEVDMPILLWLLGVPIPVILILLLLWH